MGSRSSTTVFPSEYAYNELWRQVRCHHCGCTGPHDPHQPYMVLLYGLGKYDGRALCLDCLRNKLRA